MARPKKTGMDYFPHDTDARNDLKIRKLRAIHGNDGYTFYFIMLENIYKSKDYYIDVSDAETRLILAEECRISEDKFTSIMMKCLSLDLFSHDAYERHQILTSEAIKSRTEPVEAKRNRNKEYFSNKNNDNEGVSDAETIAETIISDAETMAESTQSRVEESRVEKSRVKKNIDTPKTPSKINFADNVNMLQAEYDKLIEKYGDKVIKDKITDLSLWKTSKGRKTKSDYATILSWIRKDEKEAAQPKGVNAGATYRGKVDKFNNFEHREYDYNDLEKKLLGW